MSKEEGKDVEGDVSRAYTANLVLYENKVGLNLKDLGVGRTTTIGSSSETLNLQVSC